jgi:mRNA-degrading endonuclease RelE of RelBE toxin-antitoxin system
MAKRPKFQFVFAPEALGHLDGIEAKHHRLIERILDEQLAHAPEKETRNRKPLEQPAPFEATWELRCGPSNRFRIFYEVQDDEVWILAIGIKEGNRLLIGGEEFKL